MKEIKNTKKSSYESELDDSFEMVLKEADELYGGIREVPYVQKKFLELLP